MATKIGEEISRGGEFRIFEIAEGQLLKIPRFPRLSFFIFGDFRRKYEQDLRFLEAHFAPFLPLTRIVDFEGSWAILQDRITGRSFFEEPRMTDQARELLIRAARIYTQTGKIPDLSNPRNLLYEEQTGRLFLVDISVLGGQKWWPPGFFITRILGKILFDTIGTWLKFGFRPRRVTLR